jgi:DNA-binding transcriptional ArsR family regulator
MAEPVPTAPTRAGNAAGVAVTDTPPTPLDHRARRRILRRLHEGDRPCTAGELSAGLDLRLNEALYHLRVLVEHDTVEEKPEEGDARTRYASKIADKAKIIEVLVSTRAKDETQL